MGIINKEMTEYLYDRENPKSRLRQRITGIETIMRGVPNINERADMIGRSLAKETDGDWTKFVQNQKKPQDMGQKWRGFKNIARFFKHPVGYVYWKSSPLHETNRLRFMYFAMMFHLYSSFVLWALVKNQKEKMIENWRHRIGETNDKHTMQHKDRRFPNDRKKNYLKYSNIYQQRRNKRLGMIMTNWWCRDQNFRKYFEMRKKNGIQPATTGFKHEQIFNDVAQQNLAFS